MTPSRTFTSLLGASRGQLTGTGRLHSPSDEAVVWAPAGDNVDALLVSAAARVRAIARDGDAGVRHVLSALNARGPQVSEADPTGWLAAHPYAYELVGDLATRLAREALEGAAEDLQTLLDRLGLIAVLSAGARARVDSKLLDKLHRVAAAALMRSVADGRADLDALRGGLSARRSAVIAEHVGALAHRRADQLPGAARVSAKTWQAACEDWLAHPHRRATALADLVCGG